MSSTSTRLPTTSQARAWLQRWDAQQEHYLPDREDRFTVIADVVESVVGTEAVVVDLGAGPGSLSVRLLDRLPGARVVAVDADPLLLGLARVAYADRDRLSFHDVDLRSAAWDEALPQQVDAVVSTTALHWLTGDELGAVYAAAGRLLRPGGVLVNGDHLDEPAATPGLDVLVHDVRQRHRARTGVLDREDWESWWEAVADAEELRGLAGERGARPIDHAVPDVPSVEEHRRLLLAAGFAEAGTVWQYGDDRVLVGLR